MWVTDKTLTGREHKMTHKMCSRGKQRQKHFVFELWRRGGRGGGRVFFSQLRFTVKVLTWAGIDVWTRSSLSGVWSTQNSTTSSKQDTNVCWHFIGNIHRCIPCLNKLLCMCSSFSQWRFYGSLQIFFFLMKYAAKEYRILWRVFICVYFSKISHPFR